MPPTLAQSTAAPTNHITGGATDIKQDLKSLAVSTESKPLNQLPKVWQSCSHHQDDPLYKAW